VLSISILFVQCVTEKYTQGYVIFQRRLYDVQKKIIEKDSTIADGKLLFYKGYVVQTARKSDMVVYANQEVSVDTSIERYVFYDFKRKLISEYDTFAASARLQKKYILVDSALIPNTWNFYRNKELLFRDSLYTLTDTLMNGISYSRVAGKRQGGHLMVGYIRKDIKNSIFHFDKPLDDKMEGTIVRVDYWYLPTNKAMISSFNITRTYLTSEEEAVFNAWIKR
jgi:hypothetical protein